MTTASPAEIDAPINAVEAEFSTLFNRVRGAMKDYAAQLDPDLTVANYRIIAMLDRKGPVHAGGLAELLEMDKSVLSRQIAILTGMGLLTRTPDPNDGRSSFLSVTPETARRLHEIRSGSKSVLHEALRSWPQEDVAALAGLLHRINALPL